MWNLKKQIDSTLIQLPTDFFNYTIRLRNGFNKRQYVDA